ncbi:hypothetical protein [Pectinatus sottacetonis]|uniref:hypothetical protein n=1 Tax=Pectinatus sottacetonis TaxID=1002795 RepID=UPI0018C719D0|nr:hypothetical protein [Pectinatus sottacetonis]
MKKIIIIYCCLLCMTTTAFAAAKDTNEVQDPLDWKISAQPDISPTKEQIWSLVLENNIGVYAYDINSLQFMKKNNGKIDKDKITVIVKTIFTNKDILHKLQMQYARDMAKGEKVSYCKIYMNFAIKDKTYTDTKTEIYTNKDRIVNSRTEKRRFTAVPAKTFAEAMLEICQKFAGNENNDAG